VLRAAVFGCFGEKRERTAERDFANELCRCLWSSEGRYIHAAFSPQVFVRRKTGGIVIGWSDNVGAIREATFKPARRFAVACRHALRCGRERGMSSQELDVPQRPATIAALVMNPRRPR
jgi:hypothetical protein